MPRPSAVRVFTSGGWVQVVKRFRWPGIRVNGFFIMPSLLMCMPAVHGKFLLGFAWRPVGTCGAFPRRGHALRHGVCAQVLPGRVFGGGGAIISCCRNPLDRPLPGVLMFESGNARQGDVVLLDARMKYHWKWDVYHGQCGSRAAADPPGSCTFYDGAFFVGQISVVCRECLWLVLPGGGAMPRRV